MRPLMQAQLNDKPRPLIEVNPEVPAPIADAVMKYLRKQPRRGPESAGLAPLRDRWIPRHRRQNRRLRSLDPVRAAGACRSPASSAAPASRR